MKQNKADIFSFSFPCLSNPEKIAFLCFGNLDRADDAIGLLIARELKLHFPYVYSEEFEDPVDELLEILTNKNIRCVAVIDACDIKANPGKIVISTQLNIAETRLSTHTIPIKHLIEIINEEGKEFIFIGVQVLNTELFGEMTKEVKNAKDKILSNLIKGNR